MLFLEIYAGERNCVHEVFRQMYFCFAKLIISFISSDQTSTKTEQKHTFFKHFMTEQNTITV